MKIPPLLGRAVGLFAIRIGGALLLILQVATVAYFFGLEFVGINGIFWSAVVIFRVAGPLGLDVLGLKDSTDPDNELSDAFTASVALRDTRALAFIWGSVATLGVAIWGIAALFGAGLGILVPVVAVACAASALQRLWFVSLLARGKSFYGQICESLALPIAGIVAAVLSPRDSTEMFLLGQGLAVLLITAVFGVSALRPALKGRVAVPKIRWKSAFVIALGSSLTALAVRSPIFFVGASSARMAGEYDIAQRFQSAGSVSVSAVSTAVMPKLSSNLQAHRRRETLGLLLSSAIASAFIPGVLALLLILAGPGWVAMLLGPEYKALWLPSLLLTVASFVNALTSSVGSALSLSGRERFFAWISAVQLLAITGGVLLIGEASSYKMAGIVLAAECLRSLLLVTLYWVSRPRGKHRAP